jgi:hypothetical protein
LLLIGWTALYLASVRHAVELIPLKSYPSGAGYEAMLFNGILGAAGLAMIIPMFVPSRWRTRNDDAGSEAKTQWLDVGLHACKLVSMRASSSTLGARHLPDTSLVRDNGLDL